MLKAVGSLVLVLGSGVAFAQIQVSVPGVNVPNPGPNDIAIDTNHNTKTVSCKPGGGLFVRGNQNHLQVNGTCTAVHTLGNKNVLIVAHATQLVTEGNENTITYMDPKTQVSTVGNGNQVNPSK